MAAKHGHARRGAQTAEYWTWTSMLHRCTSKRAQKWADYGGRGITVCPEWSSFDRFLADMGRRPPGLTLERRDNDLGYSPGNCVWATRTEQQRNRRVRVDNSSGVAGIDRRNGLWRVRINGKFLANCATLAEAATVRSNAQAKLWGTP